MVNGKGQRPSRDLSVARVGERAMEAAMLGDLTVPDHALPGAGGSSPPGNGGQVDRRRLDQGRGVCIVRPHVGGGQPVLLVRSPSGSAIIAGDVCPRFSGPLMRSWRHPTVIEEGSARWAGT
jgi:hypothetical protein